MLQSSGTEVAVEKVGSKSVDVVNFCLMFFNRGEEPSEAGRDQAKAEGQDEANSTFSSEIPPSLDLQTGQGQQHGVLRVQ